MLLNVCISVIHTGRKLLTSFSRLCLVLVQLLELLVVKVVAHETLHDVEINIIFGSLGGIMFQRRLVENSLSKKGWLASSSFLQMNLDPPLI